MVYYMVLKIMKKNMSTLEKVGLNNRTYANPKCDWE